MRAKFLGYSLIALFTVWAVCAALGVMGQRKLFYEEFGEELYDFWMPRMCLEQGYVGHPEQYKGFVEARNGKQMVVDERDVVWSTWYTDGKETKFITGWRDKVYPAFALLPFKLFPPTRFGGYLWTSLAGAVMLLSLCMIAKSWQPILLALSMPLNVFIYCFQQYLIGVGRKLFSCVYSFILDFAIPVPMTFLFLAALGYRGAWIAKPVINIAVILAAVLYILRQRGTGFREKMLLLPENFGAETEHELFMEGDSMFDVIGVSRIAIAFILENGFSKHDANIVSLAIEEMAGNIVQHGFTDGRPHLVQIRILAKDGELILRLRDDCRPFNPVDRYRTQLQFEPDPEKGIAIKMMMRLVREIKYTGLYGMNNLIIRI